ncbi:monovalent cation/H+ antiporter subunit D family protein [Desulfobulbus alkaliphilus]|uniref:monovalent cation/H+ antiporter subunit D family protein n=1 Tax=Desulfobulbus alkaliphilus TaxID=869814 RepID=UPI001964B9F8|nr:monovalent cation/H+ antiporter subunit D family protein [Desulfobulbus alkaliphilus]MBM9537023.1 monovalent cation/H+ antiporter subunit D family protein [Desulfobulbus alkaliphilus]
MYSPSFYQIAPVIAVCASLAAVPLIALSGSRPNLREFWTFLAAGTKFAMVFSLAGYVLAGNVVEVDLIRVLPELSISFRVDSFGIVFALVSSFLWIVAATYTIGYMRGLDEHAQTRFFVCFALSLCAAIGVAFSGNLLTMYIFYEMLSLSTYPLVAHHQDLEGRAGARKYLVFLLGGSVGLVLPALIILFALAGTLDFAYNIQSGIVPEGTGPTMVVILFFAFLFGFAKNGVMPMHAWLPGAMVAPTPVSALLHAVAVVKVGVFCTTRVMLYVFGIDLMADLNLGIITAYIVSFTIIMASIIALTKDNLKARLAYSTVSQLSYIILGVALLAPAAIQGGIIHIVNHAFAKITLFFCAGAIYVATHKKNISEMGGLGRVMPFTFGAFAVASLSMIGAPPVAGFITKWYILVGSLDAGQMAIILVLIASTMLNVGYFAPITYKAFFGKPPAGVSYEPGIKEAPLIMVVPIMVAATISVFIGIFPGFMMQFVQMVIP